MCRREIGVHTGSRPRPRNSVSLSQGYPYFVQEFASAAWLAHRDGTVVAADLERVALGVQTMLDESIYSRQFAQVSPREALGRNALKHEPAVRARAAARRALPGPSSTAEACARGGTGGSAKPN
jgi:hypothetical protein